MEILTEIERTPGSKREGKTVYREAVRAIIQEGRRLLMVYSPVNGDYKFPGGGVAPGESQPEALAREVQEECGSVVAWFGDPFGRIIEYDLAEEPEFELFKMTSYYFRCGVEAGIGAQRLDGYEEELGFLPVWVDIDEAIATNHRVLAGVDANVPLWTRRDTFILELLQRQMA